MTYSLRHTVRSDTILFPVDSFLISDLLANHTCLLQSVLLQNDHFLSLLYKRIMIFWSKNVSFDTAQDILDYYLYSVNFRYFNCS